MVSSMDWAIFHTLNAGVATRDWLEDPVTALADALVPLYALATVVTPPSLVEHLRVAPESALPLLHPTAS